jgi:hypothetical protein
MDISGTIKMATTPEQKKKYNRNDEKKKETKI